MRVSQVAWLFDPKKRQERKEAEKQAKEEAQQLYKTTYQEERKRIIRERAIAKAKHDALPFQAKASNAMHAIGAGMNVLGEGLKKVNDLARDMQRDTMNVEIDSSKLFLIDDDPLGLKKPRRFKHRKQKR